MVKTTLQPLLILSIAKSRLTGYAMNIPKRLKKKFKKVLLIFPILLGFLALLLALYGLLSYIFNYYPLEKAIKNWDKIDEDQEFLRMELIDEKTGVAFVNYNCKSGKILKGVKKCNGEYYIFINKISSLSLKQPMKNLGWSKTRISQQPHVASTCF